MGDFRNPFLAHFLDIDVAKHNFPEWYMSKQHLSSKKWTPKKLVKNDLPPPSETTVQQLCETLLMLLGWWWYQLNTIDDANLKRSQLQFLINVIYASRTSWLSKQNCRNSGGKMKYNSDYQKYGDTKIRNTTSWVL